MTHKMFKNGPEKISLLGLGCMRLPKQGPKKEDIDYEAAQKIVDYAYEHGVNYFDTARYYHGGDSELFLGQALAKYPRDTFYLATKLPMWVVKSQEDVYRIFEEQLQRCRVDYFDFYLCHALDEDSFKTVQDLEVFDILEGLRRDGKIRRIGFSFHDAPEVLETICDAHPWDFVQLQVNALDWDIYRSEEQYNILAQRGIPCVIMEPLQGGRLADLGEEANAMLKAWRPDDSIASWSIRFAASLPGAMTVLSGMGTLQQIEDNVTTTSPLQPLAPQEHELLNEAVRLYRQRATIGCTACRYCMPCPAGVNIPGIFSLFNEEALHPGMPGAFQRAYEKMPEAERGNACVQCGQCETVCPQHLGIPALLAEIEAGKTP